MAGAGSWGGGRVKKLEQTTINKRIFIKIEVCVREGKVMTSGSDGGSSTDVALRWKKMIYTVDFAGYVTLSSGIFLHSWKHAIVNPMLEKPGFITAAISCFVLFPIYPSCPISWSVWSINTYLVAFCQFTIYFILSSQS